MSCETMARARVTASRYFTLGWKHAMVYTRRQVLVGLLVVISMVMCLAYVMQYLRVSARLDIVQASTGSLTQDMLSDRDVIVCGESEEDVINALRVLSPLILLADAAEPASNVVQVARAQYTVLYCAPDAPGSPRPVADCLVTVFHPKTSASVSIIVRPTSGGGGVIVLPPHWRYAAEEGGCAVMERRLNGAVSWIASRAGGH